MWKVVRMSQGRIKFGRLSVAEELHAFIEHEALPGTGIHPATFWNGMDALFADLAPRNRALLQRRIDLQAQLDNYYRTTRSTGSTFLDYEAFLRTIGYLVEPPAPFRVTTANIDPEIAELSGPQLVVPVLNARFATNAANARWGSLYDAFYGTNVIPDQEELARSTSYNPARGKEVIRRARAFLDDYFPLEQGSHADATAYVVDRRGLYAVVGSSPVRLADAASFVGYQGQADSPTAVLLQHHRLHAIIDIDPRDPVGADDQAGVRDIRLEAALTTIMDFEDSVAAVDAHDKVAAYRNWLKLMQGTLSELVSKGGKPFTRSLNPDLQFSTPSGGDIRLKGRALLLVRQVGHLMTTDAVVDEQGEEMPEGILDALVTSLCAVHDMRGPTAGTNSASGSIYAVKPKMHGPEEVAFTCELFERVEQILDLLPTTIKLGIMDEERRTSANLSACIHAAKDRVAFINTGFLDRTGDEIRTSTYAGPVVRKGAMKHQPWITAYEHANVDTGLKCGFAGRAQIGKGMWAAPDDMAEMLEAKVGHPEAGATCAWVPSPTAATLHALHYHAVDVRERQRLLAERAPQSLEGLLTLPIADPVNWSLDERLTELDNNIQGILGYVVRWVDAGVGCSKVPDINGKQLMEDRATCRISSQHIANWLLHDVVTREQVETSLQRMAAVVDNQNAADPAYEPMAPDFDGPAFLAARALIFEALEQPNGYTEPILHASRRRKRQTSVGV